MNISRTLALAACLGAAPIQQLWAQGRTDYFNVETPQVKPLALATLDGRTYLLACNTPDNSIEVWDTASDPPTFVARIPVGLEPCSVVWDAERNSLLSIDFLSDSVTRVVLQHQATTLTWRIDRTENIIDEPLHATLSADGTQLFVGSMSRGSIATVDPVSLTAVAPTPNSLESGAPANPVAVKETRHVLVMPRAGTSGIEHWLVALNHKGGRKPAQFGDPYDMDLWAQQLGTGPLGSGTRLHLGELGTTNTNMTLLSDGRLLVVGGLALNDQFDDAAAAADAPTGFVQSHLWVVEGFGGATTVIRDRDLNEVLAANGSAAVAGDYEALALPTDVVALESSTVTKVFIAAFGSDRIGVIELPASGNATAPLQWPRRKIEVPRIPTPRGGAAGPRGLALRTGAQPRLYVLNRLDQAIVTIDPVTEAVLGVSPLARDPNPAWIAAGRHFLYSAKLSKSGFVACASCHMDGRTDVLGWKLSSQDPAVPTRMTLFDGPTRIDQTQLDAIVNGTPTEPALGISQNKRRLVTQSLQGLLNWEVKPNMQNQVSNRPYHWRADRATFRDFVEGFTGLLKTPDPNAIDMVAFEAFINSIHYPPNPEQPVDRVYSGTLGDSNDLANGTGAARGLKLFHILPLEGCANRSCVQCHSLPEGSNNRVTEFVINNGTGLNPPQDREPLETSALRGMRQKERRAVVGTQLPTSATPSGMFGLANAGTRHTLSGFVNGSFVELGGQAGAAMRDAILQYLFEFDTGTAPAVGRVATLTQSQTGTGPVAILEKQATEANVGLTARFWSNGTVRGFHYDATSDQYREVPGGAPISRSSLINLLQASDDRLIFLATPLGSERRIAAPSGAPDPVPQTTASSVVLLGMRPNTANVDIPAMTKNWDPDGNPGLEFNWNPTTSLATPLSLHAQRLMQQALIQYGTTTPAGFGLTELRHDAPRRFRLAGNAIQPGAKLILHTPKSSTPPNTSAPPLANQVNKLEIPIYATATTHVGLPVWESAVELEPPMYYMMMLGGPNAPGVPEATTDYPALISEKIPLSITFDPLAHNWHYVELENPGQAPVAFGWQRLTID